MSAIMSALRSRADTSVSEVSGFRAITRTAPIAACTTVVVSLVAALAFAWGTIAPVAVVLVGGGR